MGVAPVQVAHFCPSCDMWYEGYPPSEALYLASDYSEGHPYDEVETYTVWECGDPAGACELEEQPRVQMNIWKCSECGDVYEGVADAMECCQ